MSSCIKINKGLFHKADGNTSKLVVEVNSKHAQIGDNCTATIDCKSFPEYSDCCSGVQTIDFNNALKDGDRELTAKADIVQVEPEGDSWPIDVEVRLNLLDNGTAQIGDNSKLFINEGKERKTAGQQGRRTQRKSRRKPRKPTNKPKPNKIINTHPVSEEAVKLYNQFAETALAVLHPLRDAGKWDLFIDKLNEFRCQHGSDVLWDILLTLEQAQQMCYHLFEDNGQQAAQMVSDILNHEIPRRLRNRDPSIKQLLEGRAYCCLASIYRHQNDNLLGKAERCLDEALARLKDTEFLYDQALVYYEKASMMLDFDKSNAKLIRECLDKCTELCQEINKHKKWDFVKKGRYAIYKKVMWLLNSNTKGGRKRKISDENLQEAKRYLDELESKHGVQNDVPASERLQRLLANSDQAFRTGLFHEAKEVIEKAISLATCHGFDEAPALRRLKDIDTMLSKNTRCYNKDSESEVEESGSPSSSAGDADASS